MKFDKIREKAVSEYRERVTEIRNEMFVERVCCRCGGRARHMVGGSCVCCRCYVEAGYPPSDWHEDCMKAYEDKKKGFAPKENEK